VGRVLMLVPHEPDDDPRIGWAAALCAEVARTDVLGIMWATEKPEREYDGAIYVERVGIGEHSSEASRWLSSVCNRLSALGPATRYEAREGRPLEAGAGAEAARQLGSGLLRRLFDRLTAMLDHQLGGLIRFLAAFSYGAVLVSALYRRGRAISVVPGVIVCHDLYALVPAIRLKRRFGCPVVYDSHEYWPQADLIGPPWQTRVLGWLEGAYARRADVVITVSPPLARQLGTQYRLRDVLSVPNAEPFRPDIRPSCARRPAWPVRFLLQGRVAPGRGIDALLRTWISLDDERAVLCLRCPDTPYLSQLRDEFGAAIARERIVLLPPVREHELIPAAAECDVGVIPYVGPNLNHVFACPNKLSQYMHAGLAILSNRLDFIAEVIRRYDCGLTYDAASPATFAACVRQLAGDLERLHAMKSNAYRAVVTEFNWETQSRPYRTAVEALCRERCT
jgi:glycosyltransferase involved in cell wall biosynthesis